MNQNIEVINKHLIAVSFARVEAGWIHGLSFDRAQHNPHAEVTQKGEIVLNKDDPELCILMKKVLLNQVMPKTNKCISEKIVALENIRNTADWNNDYNFLLFLYRLEQLRRRTKPRKKWFGR